MSFSNGAISESTSEMEKLFRSRAIGVNLEPVDKEVLMSENRTEISSGRIVSPETLKKANELGF
ncbi:DUF7916 family protein, partial [Enterococcus faecium]